MELPELETVYTPMRELVRGRLKAALNYAKSNFARGGQTVLVLDQLSKRIISSALTLFEILELGFVLVENIKLKRQPCPNFDVVYVINPDPRKSSITRMLKDYKASDAGALPEEKDCMDKLFPCLFPDLVLPPQPTRYRNATICITQGSPREVEDRVKALARVERGNRFTRNLKAVTELGIQFLAMERDVFSLDMPTAFSDLYAKEGDPDVIDRRTAEIAERLTSAVCALNEYPYIRYADKSLKGTARSVATHTQRLMDEYFRINTTLSPWGLGGTGRSGRRATSQLRKDRGVLIIVDRTEDLVAPLLHEFTYQAMATDLLDGLEPGMPYESRFTEKTDPRGPSANKTKVVKKTVMLDDTDPVWVELRHMHAVKVIEWLKVETAALQRSAVGRAQADGDAVKADMKAMSELVAALATQDKNRVTKFKLHQDLTAEIMKRFSTWGLDKTSVLEQTVATGVDGSGKTISRRKVWGEVAEFLEENKRRSDACHTEIAGLSKKDKETKRALKAEIRHHAETRARILALFMIAMGGLDDDGLTALNQAELDQEHANGLLNLPALGKNVKAGKKAKAAQSSKELALNATRAKEAEFDMSRFVPALSDRVEEHIHDSLSYEDYPYTTPPPARMEAEALGTSGGSGDPSASTDTSSKSKRRRKHRWDTATPAADGGGGGAEEAKAEDAAPQYEGGRVIVFVIGGMTYSETRALSELSYQTHREIVMGSTSLLSPKLFLEQLHLLDPELAGADEDAVDSDDSATHSRARASGGAGGDGGSARKKDKKDKKHKKHKKHKRSRRRDRGGSGDEVDLDDVDLDEE